MMNKEYLISKKITNHKKHPGNAVFLLVFIISMILCSITPQTLPAEIEKEKNKDKKKQAESSQAAESKKKLEPKPKAKPLTKSKPGSKSGFKQFKRVLIAGEPTKYTGEPGTFIFNEADLKDVLLFFGRTYKLNVIIDPGVSGKVTIRLFNVPWDQALDLILRQHGLAMTKNGNLITAKKLKK
jgi:type II secretory pathway component HofQ